MSDFVPFESVLESFIHELERRLDRQQKIHDALLAERDKQVASLNLELQATKRAMEIMQEAQVETIASVAIVMGS